MIISTSEVRDFLLHRLIFTVKEIIRKNIKHLRK